MYARTGVRRRSKACASGNASKRTVNSLRAENDGSATTAPRARLLALDPGQVERDARAARRGVARFTEDLQAAHARGGPERLERNRIADGKAPLHQRSGHDRAAAGSVKTRSIGRYAGASGSRGGNDASCLTQELL